MLQDIRDKSQGWMAWTIIIVLCLAFIGWGFSSYFHLGKSDIVAMVDGQKITHDQVQRVYQQLQQKEQQALGQDYASKALPDKALWQQAFNTVLITQVLYSRLIKLGLYVSDDQINAIIASIPAFLDQGQFSQQRYLAVLGGQGLSPQTFTQEVKSQFINGQLRAAFQDGAFVLPDELNEFIALGLQQRKMHYAVISAKSFINRVKVKPVDVSNYYQRHQDLFKTPETVSIDYLTLSADALAKTIKPSQMQIKDYYNMHQNEYQVVGKKGVIQPLSKVQLRISKAIALEKAQALLANDSETLANLTYENPDNLAIASKALNLPVQHSASFTRQGASSGIGATPKVISNAFSDDVLKNSNNSDLITLDHNTIVVLRVAKYTPARLQPLSLVKQQIIDTLKTKASSNAAQTAGLALLAKLNKGVAESQLKQTVPLNWAALTIKRDSKKPDLGLIDYTFTLPLPVAQKPNYGGVELSSGDYALVAVDQVMPGKLTETGNKLVLAKTDYRHQLAQVMANYDYDQFLSSLIKQAKIKIKDRQFKNELIDRLAGA